MISYRETLSAAASFTMPTSRERPRPLAKISIIPKLGYAPVGMPIENKEEMGKTLLS